MATAGEGSESKRRKVINSDGPEEDVEEETRLRVATLVRLLQEERKKREREVTEVEKGNAQLEEARAQLEKAKAQLEKRRAQLKKTSALLEGKQARVRKTEREIESMEGQLLAPCRLELELGSAATRVAMGRTNCVCIIIWHRRRQPCQPEHSDCTAREPIGRA